MVEGIITVSDGRIRDEAAFDPHHGIDGALEIRERRPGGGQDGCPEGGFWMAWPVIHSTGCIRSALYPDVAATATACGVDLSRGAAGDRVQGRVTVSL